MKTFILNIEPHDDIVSIRDKMGWAKNSRILIVWPNMETSASSDLPSKTVPLNRRLDMVLIQRQSQAMGSQLALVSKDPDVNYFGPRLGIPVYKSLRKAQNQHWRLPLRFRKNKPKRSPGSPIFKDEPTKDGSATPARPFPQRPTDRATALGNPPREMHPVVRLLFFAAGVLALLAIAATLAPSAEISLVPRTEVQDVLIEATTDPLIELGSSPSSSPDDSPIHLSGKVPSELVTVIVEGRDIQPASGSITLPYQSATGKAIFTNLTDQTVEIPAGTVVSPVGESRARYETTRAALAPAGPGQTVEVEIESLTPGKSGNLAAGKLAALEGLLGTQLSVSNPDPISGGSDRQDPAPTQKDRGLLASRLQNALQETALAEIESQLHPQDLLIPSSLELVQIISQKSLPEQDSPADQLIMTMSVEFQARVVRHASMESLVQAVFDANLEPGYLPIQGSQQFEIVAQNDSDPFTWTIHAVRRVQAQIGQAEVVRLVLALPPEQVPALLEQTLPLEATPSIRLQPDWWLRMPVLPFRISVLNGYAPGDVLDRYPEENKGSG